MSGLVSILLPIAFIWFAICMLASSGKRKVADNANAAGTVTIGLFLIFMGIGAFWLFPRMVAVMLGTPSDAHPQTPAGPVPTFASVEHDAVVWVQHVAGAVLPWLLGLAVMLTFVRGLFWIVNDGVNLLLPHIAHARRVRALRRRRRAHRALAPSFVRLAIRVARRARDEQRQEAARAAGARLVERWGPRPAVMTRCVECHRNVWPACQCALARAGYEVTFGQPTPAPVGEELPSWGTAPADDGLEEIAPDFDWSTLDGTGYAGWRCRICGRGRIFIGTTEQEGREAYAHGLDRHRLPLAPTAKRL